MNVLADDSAPNLIDIGKEVKDIQVKR
jgi:hypothetical protein